MNGLDLPAQLALPASALLGLLVGSFLNVVILRLPRRLEWQWQQQAHEILGNETIATNAPAGIVLKASHCPHCGHPLAAWDNIPLLSWLWLKGRCRYCQTRISVQYPLVECLSAVLSLAAIWHFGANMQGYSALVFTWFIVALAGIDARTQLLPDKITLPLLWLGLLLSLQATFITPEKAIIGAAAGYLVLWCIYWLFKLLTGKEGMGYGDFKLLAALGAWMGPLAILPILLLSSLFGAIIGGVYLKFSKHASTAIPFGPFLAMAGWVWLVAGDQLWSLYAQVSGLN